MRSPRASQDPLRTPLNRYLGTEGNVRVLRILCFTHDPMGRSAVARRAELHPTGVRRILDGLADEGLVDSIGSGRNQAVFLRDEHPLAAPLRNLFREERSLYERTVTALRNAVAAVGKPIDALWIEGPSSSAAGIIDVGIFGGPDLVDSAARDLEERLSSLGEHLTVHFAVHAYTDIDAELAVDEDEDRFSDVTLVHGWIPLRWRTEGGGPIRSHADLDERARRLASAIADRLPNEPAIIDRAVEWIDQRLSEATGREVPALEEWRRILTRLSLAQIRKLLVEDSERARELRQSLPFAEALSNRERRSLLAAAEAQ